MREDKWPKRTLDYCPSKRKRRGRPAIAWLDGGAYSKHDTTIREREWQNRKVCSSK